MQELMQDLRYGMRVLLRNPLFAIIALLTITIGIGLVSAIFSVINAVLIRSLPYSDPDRLVAISEKNLQKGRPSSTVSVANFNDWRDQAHSFEQLASSRDQTYNLTGIDEPENILGYRLSANFFQVLGVQAALGRTFLADEEKPGNDRVVVLSHRLWQRLFGGNPDVLGSTFTLNGASYTVIGVMPEEFQYPNIDTEIWTPLVLDPRLVGNREIRYLRVIARLRPGGTFEAAQREMDSIAGRLEQQYPDTNAGWGATLTSIGERRGGDIRPALFVLLVAVIAVLLIACVNVANLLLVRAIGRKREIALRAAIGATPLRLVRQFLAESILLAVLGGAMGLVLAYFSARALVALFPPTIANLNIPRLSSIPIDARVLIFTIVASLVTGLIFGMLPALQAAKPDLNYSLKEGGKGLGGGTHGSRIRNLLVVSEVALALMLLISAGLLLKGFGRLQGNDLGFNPERVLTMRFQLPQYKYPDAKQRRLFLQQLLERVKNVPGVETVGLVNFLPLSGWQGSRPFSVEGGTVLTAAQQPEADYRSISADYFLALSVPLLKGRYFTEYDNENALQVAIINETMANRFWPGEDPIGKRLKVAGFDTPDWREVVGVVKDIKHTGPLDESRPELYRPYLQDPWPLAGLAVRANSEPTRVANAVRKEIWAIDNDQPVSYVMSMEQLASESITPQRVTMLLVGIFGIVALILAAVGIYGIMSYSVNQRQHEIGVRMALGAQRRDILKLVVGEGMMLAVIGLVAGLVASYVLTRVMSSQLYGVSPKDPLIFIGVSLLLFVTALMASYVPAYRATKVDPMISLRYE